MEGVANECGHYTITNVAWHSSSNKHAYLRPIDHTPDHHCIGHVQIKPSYHFLGFVSEVGTINASQTHFSLWKPDRIPEVYMPTCDAGGGSVLSLIDFFPFAWAESRTVVG